MSEQTSEREQSMEESPLRTERGYTSVDQTIVSQIADRAAREVPGIYLDGRNQQSTGGGQRRGSRGPSRGISVEVGMVETSIDVVMGMDYGWNIGEVTERLREVLTERIETLTGLSVRDINITISDVVLPDKDRLQARDGDDDDDRPDVHRLENLRTDEAGDDYDRSGEGYGSPRDEEDEELRELRARIERGEETEDERVRRARSESLDRDDDDEEVRVEGRDLGEGETAEIDPDDDIDRGTGDRRRRDS